ncbi:MAG: PQQ-binding-like beta-propeller repeat protein [Phycisphaerae bacterium]|nr:PQQ-binding-like beta-propeller repeat protein [Phycisphaerae bacterium]NIU11038.1 PQQ-binding-like beta-propeller repeat protein [Phycisphaerae bacterium]NIU58353.1 PQQ-binding-like beta-propeller repeat protein [Phycisphaerae bacterium]NIW95228.1 PQQ-binding-like beta-propeller repeat protein [Phycisphaerae bacterium]
MKKTNQFFGIPQSLGNLFMMSVCLLTIPCISLTAQQKTYEQQAEQILRTTGVKGGLIVHIGCGDGKLTAALRANDSYQIHGLDIDAKNIEKARRHIQSLELYGKVSVDRLYGNSLPYIDNLVNLIVSENLGGIPVEEVLRVLVPNGVAYIKKGGRWTKAIKPHPEEIDEWTHYMHDAGGNAVAHDSVVGPPRHLQWQGSPRWSRHHDHMSSVSACVSAGGRLFYIFDEGKRSSILLPPKWFLIARDAFNGTILWKRGIHEWYTHMMRLKNGPAVLPRRLVAVGDQVYVTLGIQAQITALDAATGRVVRSYKETEDTQELVVSDGVLFIVANRPKKEGVSDRHNLWDVAQRRIMAVRAETGEILWQKEWTVLPMTLAADSKRVYFNNGERIICLDRKNGGELWTSKPIPRWSKLTSYYGATLVVYEDVVLYSGGEKMIPHRGGSDMMTALSARNGKILWTAEHPPSGYQSPEDLLVADGLVWTGATTSGGYSGIFTGRDPKTGEVKVEFPPDVETYWFHHRCYRGKATNDYLLISRTGIEFIDINKKRWEINHWIRGACLYGIMPCNGLIYAPPHPCACYPEAKQYGFSAVASAAGRVKRKVSKGQRLEKGPAYGKVAKNEASQEADWPTYRYDPARSGFTRVSVPADLKRAWESDLGGKLSSVVKAGNKVFVAKVDAHEVYALDADSGKTLWSYTAGGRVDSPPTIYKGMAIFGCADGYVYSLRASDGRLVWRFRAAPDNQRLIAFEQVESVWPVHGSVLVQNGLVYCVAGRSMFLDGGMRLLQLDTKTGRKVSEKVLDDRDPETGKNLQTRIQILNMPVALPDILSSDGKYVYMRSQKFDMSGKRLEIGPHSGDPAEQGSVQQGEGAHLFCPSGFLDDSYWHRSYWVYGRSFAGGHGGYFQAGKFTPAGRMLVFDDSTVYGFGRKAKYYRWTTPIEHHLFADDKNEPRSPAPARKANNSTGGPWISIENSKSLNPAGKPLVVEAWVRADKRNGVILARGGPSHGYALLIRGGEPQFVVRANQKVSTVKAGRKVVGKWVHLAGMLTAEKKVKIYVDGKLAGTAEAKKLISSDPAQAMQIGADADSAVGDYTSPLPFMGLIDEVRVYYGTVTDAEIAAHSTTPGKATAQYGKLVLCMTFDNGKATDESGNENHGRAGGLKTEKGRFGSAMKFTGAGATRLSAPSFPHRWARDLPMFVHAMVLADKTLFIAGPPDMIDEDQISKSLDVPGVDSTLAEQNAGLEGKKGSLLRVVSASDGEKLAEYKLESVPVWDSMAASDGRLYLAMKNGRVLCFAGKE